MGSTGRLASGNPAPPGLALGAAKRDLRIACDATTKEICERAGGRYAAHRLDVLHLLVNYHPMLAPQIAWVVNRNGKFGLFEFYRRRLFVD